MKYHVSRISLHFPPQSPTIEQYPIICRTTSALCQLYIKSQFLGMSPNIWLAPKGLLHSCSAQLPLDENRKNGRYTETVYNICLSILQSLQGASFVFLVYSYQYTVTSPMRYVTEIIGSSHKSTLCRVCQILSATTAQSKKKRYSKYQV